MGTIEIMHATKIALLAGISVLALQLAAPAALAADMPVKAPLLTKAPPAPPRGVWTWWAEGGWSDVGGDPLVAGFNSPAFDIMPKRWGLQGAVGVDYRFALSPWHLSADFRYMTNGTNSAGGPETAIFVPGPGGGGGAGAVTGTNTATRKEHNWEADFMVGRDLDIGNPAQLKVGLRVADIWGQTNGTASWAYALITPPPLTGAYAQSRNYQQTNKFLGVGPRAAIEGSVPLQGAWSFDYNGGIAGLFGRNSANQTVGVTPTSTAVPPVLPVCVSGCPIAVSSNSDVFVFNADAQAGIAYAFSPGAKLSLNYRFEGYWNALRGFNAAGAPTNLARTYNGPTLKLTVAY